MTSEWAVANGRVRRNPHLAVRLAACALLTLSLYLLSSAQVAAPTGAVMAGPQNVGFEEGQPSSTPPGWRVSPRGYRAQLTADTAKSGKYCAVLSRDSDPNPLEFGNLMQSFDATSYRGKRVRLRAAVRTDGSSRDRAQLWMRVDLPNNAMGFFDNMQNRPIQSAEWKYYDIIGDVAEDAQKIFLGVMLTTGSATPPTGKLWIDDVTFEVLANTPKVQIDAPAPLTARGLENEIAFARLYGLVKFFHPTDAATEADWNAIAINGARAVESAADARELGRKLTSIFAAMAPTLRVLPAGEKYELPVELQPAAGETRKITYWKHRGMGRGSTQTSIYHSERVQEVFRPDAATPMPQVPWQADLGGGVKAFVPLALFVAADAATTKVSAPDTITPVWTAKDRATRFADVIIAWNIAQHFYPYFDVVKTDWPAALRSALQAAAMDADESAFDITLERLVAQLHDGHGGVHRRYSGLRLPLSWDWVEDKLIVTAVKPDVANLLTPGDAVVKIDGRPVTALLAEREELISGATSQWIRWRALQDLATPGARAAAGAPPLSAQVEIESFAQMGKTRTISLPYEASSDVVQEHRPEKVAEIEPGVMYLDISRMSDSDFAAAMPRLEKATGIVIDFRGYPRLMPTYLRHFSDRTMTSAQWHVPLVIWPDGKDMKFERGGEWQLTPLPPLLNAKKAFITDGRAISYAESCMGIVENYRLGAIIGAPTAGTNGNVNPVQLPGGYNMTWTGMKVLKHDGSQHHGIGIRPTIPLQRTRAAIAAGRDEFLEAAVDAVKTNEATKSLN